MHTDGRRTIGLAAAAPASLEHCEGTAQSPHPGSHPCASVVPFFHGSPITVGVGATSSEFALIPSAIPISSILLRQKHVVL
jgi:hypothetical protein